jgi:uncharacterized membrane protein
MQSAAGCAANLPFWTHLFALGIMEALSGRGNLASPYRGDGRVETSVSLNHPLLTAALWLAVILALLALAIASLRTLVGLAVSGLGKWRDGSADDRPTASELLTKFKEVHARGGLSDDEFRTIKTKLAAELETELNVNSKSG